MPARDRKSTRLNSSHLGISYAVFCLILPQHTFTLFPYTTLFRSLPCSFHQREHLQGGNQSVARRIVIQKDKVAGLLAAEVVPVCEHPLEQVTVPDSRPQQCDACPRSEEHTSELQSLRHLVCRLLLDTPTAYIYTLSLHDALPIFALFVSSARALAGRKSIRRPSYCDPER